MKIKIKEGIELTVDEAKELYLELHKLFGENAPVITYPVVPCYPTYPVWEPIITCKGVWVD